MNEKYQFLRQRIEHEDNLINQRLAALVGSQSFLLTAFAISLNAPREFFSSGYIRAHRLLTHMLPVAGIATVVVLLLTMLGAVIALRDLHRMADQLATPGDPPLHSSRPARLLGQAAVVGVPVIFLLLWLALLVEIHHT